jgi:hypothetical protein
MTFSLFYLLGLSLIAVMNSYDSHLMIFQETMDSTFIITF